VQPRKTLTCLCFKNLYRELQVLKVIPENFRFNFKNLYPSYFIRIVDKCKTKKIMDKISKFKINYPIKTSLFESYLYCKNFNKLLAY
jgi:hypothetical protein